MSRKFGVVFVLALLISLTTHAVTSDHIAEPRACHSIFASLPLLPFPSDVEENLIPLIAEVAGLNSTEMLAQYHEQVVQQHEARQRMALEDQQAGDGFAFVVPSQDGSGKTVEFAPYTLLYVAQFVVANSSVPKAKLPQSAHSANATNISYFYDAVDRVRLAEGSLHISDSELSTLMSLLKVAQEETFSEAEIRDMLHAIIEDASHTPGRVATPELARVTLTRMVKEHKFPSIKAKRINKTARITRILDRLYAELIVPRIQHDCMLATSPLAAELGDHYKALIKELELLNSGKRTLQSNRLLKVIEAYQTQSNQLIGNRALLDEHLSFTHDNPGRYHPQIVEALRATFAHKPTRRDLIYLRIAQGAEVVDDNAFLPKIRQLGYSMDAARWVVQMLEKAP